MKEEDTVETSFENGTNETGKEASNPVGEGIASDINGAGSEE